MPFPFPPERRLRQAGLVGKLLLALFILFVLIGLLFPAISGAPKDARRARAKNDVMTLFTALKQYRTEYGYLPEIGTTRIEDEVTQARLIRMLQGDDETLNPRKIVFFEAQTALKRGQWGNQKYMQGIHPESGAFLDPWGHPYRIWLGSGESTEWKCHIKIASRSAC